MEFTSKLSSIFQLVNDWLKFSEAKNAIFLAFLGASITAIVTYLSAASISIASSLRIGLLVSVVSLCISALICAVSFLPKTDLERLNWLRAKPSNKTWKALKDTDNLLYFNDLKKYNPTELLESVSRLYFANKILPPYKKEDLDIANQIVINSEIAAIKLKLFIAVVWTLIFSFLAIPASLLISLLLYQKF
jgi:hypothetical protein